MRGIIEKFFLFPAAFPTVPVQKNKGTFNIDFFKPSPDLTYLFWIIGIFLVLIFMFAYLNEKYLRRKHKKEFITEMKELHLEPEVAATLSDIAKKNDIREPVEILNSPRMFDEMAAAEMMKILAGTAPQKTKEAQINNLYQARNKAFQSTLTVRTAGEKPVPPVKNEPTPSENPR